MIRKSVSLLIFSLIFTVSTISAQKEIENFLGTWKLDISKSEGIDGNRTKSMTLVVSEDDGSMAVETNTEDVVNKKVVNNRRVEFYKLNGSTKVSLIGGRSGGIKHNYLKFIKPDELELRSKFMGDYNSSRMTQIWMLSNNGKTLTIRSLSRASYVNNTQTPGGGSIYDRVFTKQ